MVSFNRRVADAQMAFAEHADVLAKAIDHKQKQLFYGIDTHDLHAVSERTKVLLTALKRAHELMRNMEESKARFE